MQYFAFCGDINGCRRASPYAGGSGSLGLTAPVGSAQRCFFWPERDFFVFVLWGGRPAAARAGADRGAGVARKRVPG